jgi:hypothetical protein
LPNSVLPSGTARNAPGSRASVRSSLSRGGRRRRRPPAWTAVSAPLLLLLAGVAAATIAPAPVPQSSAAFGATETGIPWLGLLGWNISAVAGTTQFASTNVTGPSLALQTKRFVVLGPINTLSTYLWVTLEVAPGAPVAQEFTLYLYVNGTDSITPTRIPGFTTEHFLQTQNSTTSATNVTVVFNIGGSTATIVVRSVTVVAAVCPRVGTCP